MPRRRPATQPGGHAVAQHHLAGDDLDELLTQAAVPKARRKACIAEITTLFRWYEARLAGLHRINEAGQAEALRLVADAAKELLKALAALPPGLRLAIEPDYRAFIVRGGALHVVRATAHTVASLAAAQQDPAAQPLADEALWREQAARRHVAEMNADLLPRTCLPLPLEVILGALVETADKRRADFEKVVSRERTRRRGILARSELALNLKAIAMGYSPTLRKDERAAEDWTAVVLSTAYIRYPDPERNPTGFRAMFAR